MERAINQPATGTDSGNADLLVQKALQKYREDEAILERRLISSTVFKNRLKTVKNIIYLIQHERSHEFLYREGIPCWIWNAEIHCSFVSTDIDKKIPDFKNIVLPVLPAHTAPLSPGKTTRNSRIINRIVDFTR